MNISRRGFLAWSALTSALTHRVSAKSEGPGRATAGPRVVTPNGSVLQPTISKGIKEFHLVAEPVEREFAPGMVVQCWGYNGSTPGPTIEAYEGDTVRIFVTNHLPEHTSVHWHGILLPNGMDGVGGLNQPHIKPGETYRYEFTLNQHGTFMYHPHADEVTQLALGMMGMFVIHPRTERRAIDRDFAISLHEWKIHPGTSRPDPAAMFDFNTFSMNAKVFPGIEPLVVRLGQRVRIRLGNLSMDQHPIHLHGHTFKITATDGGPIPETAQWPETTVAVPVGSTRDIEFVANVPGDWAFHCHRSHHTMNAMGHDIANMIGVPVEKLKRQIGDGFPGFLAMGETGMAEHSKHLNHLEGPANTLPMMSGSGPYGPIEMGGMFTVLKVREQLTSYEDPGWYKSPPGELTSKV